MAAITFSTISDGTNTNSVTRIVKGTATAWVNFNGTSTVTIVSSYNVSSITDNGIGDYTLNFTNQLSTNTYCHVFGGNIGTGFLQADAVNIGYASATKGGAPVLKTVSQLQILAANSGGANAEDLYICSVTIFGGA